jgi:hypothetical protein
VGRRSLGERRVLGVAPALVGALLALAAAPPAVLASGDANWGAGVELTPPANAAAAPQVFVDDLSCPSAGDCTAIGSYTDSSGHRQGFVLSESSGTWGQAAEVALPANAATDPQVGLMSLSCPSAGDCSAVGSYTDSSGDVQGFVLDETSGAWATASEVGLPAGAASNPKVSLVRVSCPTAGNCGAIGYYTDSSTIQRGLLLSETAGTWSTGVEVSLPADAAPAEGLDLNDVACPAAGDCTVVGEYYDSSIHLHGLLVSETSGTWGAGAEATPPADASANGDVLLSRVACPSLGNCTAVGAYDAGSDNRQGMVLSQTSGTWGTATAAPLPAGAGSNQDVFLNDLACPSVDNCTAYGDYFDTGGASRGLLLTEASGTWAALEAPAPVNAGSSLDLSAPISCASAGNCALASGYTDAAGHNEGWFLTQSAGSFGPGVEVSPPANAGPDPNVSLGRVSCTAPGVCTAVGEYTDSSGNRQGMILEAAPASPTVSASAPASVYVGDPVFPSATLAGGAAPVGTVAFRVFGPQSSPPSSCSAGGTTVGTASVSGNGAYQPSTGFTSSGPGDYWWYASYGGDAGDNPAASTCAPSMAETVVSPKASPFLTLSAPSSATVGAPVAASAVVATLTGGSAETGTLNFTVFGPEPDPPSACASGGTPLGAASVFGDGTYSPPAGFNPTAPGSYWWYAAYSGDTANNSAASHCGFLMQQTSVAPASPTLSLSAPATGTVGLPIAAASLAATMAGGDAPAGAVTFTVFGPQPSPPSSCASGGTAVATATISGDGSYQPSAGFTPSSPGDYWWYAGYGGDPSNNRAASACGGGMSETVVAAPTTVRPPAPALSHVRLSARRIAVHKDASLELTVSQPATITVIIRQIVTGHEHDRACGRAVKRGRRCTTAVKRRTLRLSAPAGHGALRLRLASLSPGTYTATLTAHDTNGTSKPVKLGFTIVHVIARGARA